MGLSLRRHVCPPDFTDFLSLPLSGLYSWSTCKSSQNPSSGFLGSWKAWVNSVKKQFGHFVAYEYTYLFRTQNPSRDRLVSKPKRRPFKRKEREAWNKDINTRKRPEALESFRASLDAHPCKCLLFLPDPTLSPDTDR